MKRNYMREWNEKAAERAEALKKAEAAYDSHDENAFKAAKADAEAAEADMRAISFLMEAEDNAPVVDAMGILGGGAEAMVDIGGGKLLPKAVVQEVSTAIRRGVSRAAMVEGTPADGGYTVPAEVETLVRQWRDETISLIDYVNASPTDKASGRMIYQKRSTVPGFASTAELGAIKLIQGPQFEPVDWSVSKYTGALAASNELMEDSDANITATIVDWLGRNARATENRLILGILTGKSPTALTTLDGLRKTLNTTLGPIYKPYSAIYTNEFGMDFLDSLKDATGRQLLNPDPTASAEFRLRAGANLIPIVEVSSSVLANSSTNVPFIMGSLKDAVMMKNRAGLSIRPSYEAALDGFNAYEQDAILFRGIMRLSATKMDDKSWVYQQLDTSSVTASSFVGN